MTDTEILDYVESLKVGYGDGWILRKSSNGRGMRLHETIMKDTTSTVRQAIEQHAARSKGVPF